MCKVVINSELNGIEVSFDSKPEANILTSLKDNGFRWHNKKKLWYAKITDDRLQLANSLSDVSVIPAVKDNQKELIEDVMRDYDSIWGKDAKMMDYLRKNIAYVVKLKEGYFVIEKPTIETHFCFGFGYCGVTTQEEMEEAEKTRYTAAHDTDYFIKENMKEINAWLKDLSERETYGYINSIHETRIYSIACLDSWNTERYQNMTGFYKLSEEEVNAVIEGYNVVKKQFEKRLNTYLKKYGLSKLHTWTYLSD